MKIVLVQPNLDRRHSGQRQAYGSSNRPPETGLAVLGSWVKAYSAKKHDVRVLNPNKGLEEIAEELAESDIAGISDWFSNHDNCVSLAKKVKAINPKTKIVFGGPNASMIPEEILANHPCVDFVISRDGEDSLLALAEEKPVEQVPNLWFRNANGEIGFTFRHYTDLAKVPLWDFSDFQNWEQRLSEYLEAQKKGLDPWLVPTLTLFSFRGCIKAVREGVCSYCTSSEERGRALPPKKIWSQILHLNKKYGAEVFYMCDDIFPVTPKRIREIAEAKPKNAKARIRAYGYLPDLAKLSTTQLKEFAKNLKKIGVFNLFFGSENYCPNILAEINKQGVTVEETAKIIKVLHDEGKIKTTIAYLLGLPQESKESLEQNLKTLEKLLKVDGCIERLYISIGMPLKGTIWFKKLAANKDIVTEYREKTGKDIIADDSPDYALLSKLSIKHTTTTTPEEINHYLNKMIELAGKKMPDYRIGGFLLDLSE
jgi:radical SAM superfamily enzyme YgiQ (UPF0313 family)